MVLGQLEIHMPRMKLDPFLSPYTKMNSKWIRDLNIRAKTIKLLEENIGVDLCDLGLGSGFLDMTPNVQATKEKKTKTKKQINWTSSKLETFVL